MKNQPNKNSSVVGISSVVDEYRSALEFYRKYSTMPTYCRLLKKALAANVKLSLIESHLELLHGISLEQYFCPKGCYYLKAMSFEDYKEANIDFPYSVSNTEVSKYLWDIFRSFKSKELYGFENYLVGQFDFYYLSKSGVDIVEAIKTKVPDFSGETGTSPLAQIGYEHAVESAETEKYARTRATEAEDLGLNMIPWSALVTDTLKNNKELKAGLVDFSDYLSSYFTDNDLQRDVDDESVTGRTLDAEDATSLMRISSFLLFYSLVFRDDQKNIATSYDDFFIERLVNYSSLDAFLNCNERAEYIISISNLLMMCGKFDVESVESGLVTVDELKRKFLVSCTSKYLDTACLA